LALFKTLEPNISNAFGLSILEKDAKVIVWNLRGFSNSSKPRTIQHTPGLISRLLVPNGIQTEGNSNEQKKKAPV
jgi:hypothetical protein